MTDLDEVVGYLNAVAFGAIGMLAVRRWRGSRTDPARHLALAFGALGLVSVAGLVLPSDPTGFLGLAAQRLLVLAIVLYAWALVRFLGSFETLSSRATRIANAAGLLVALTAVMLPSIPSDDAERPWWFQVWVLGFLAYWVGAHGLVAVRLWRAGAELPALPRRRARLLASGAAMLAIVLLPAASGGGIDNPVVSGVVTVLPTVAAVVFYFGFAPPEWLKTQWRRPGMASLRDATIGLMSMKAVNDIADALLPHAASVLGGSSARLVDGDGTVLATYRADSSAWAMATVAVDVGQRRLEVDTGPYTPFFGSEESGLLEGLGAFIDIAIDRAEALSSAQDARRDAEAATAELETLVFGLSHDLKSPVISLLGYLEYLEEDHAASLDEEGRFFLERMRASATYMQDLIGDLLELSRVGRVQTDVVAVPVAEVVAEVGARLAPSFPSAAVETLGALPVIRANALRAQQLISNLVENAYRHGGRPDVKVTVSAQHGDDGAVVYFDDDGVGVPPEHWETVFGIFERLDASAEGHRGTGIGLAMCRRIATLLGGSLDIVDGAPGTRFRLTVPGAALLGWTDARRTDGSLTTDPPTHG